MARPPSLRLLTLAAMAVHVPACTPPQPACAPADPAPAIDWQDTSYLANLALEVTHASYIGDDQQLQKYSGPGLTLLLRPIPSTGARYLVILDPARHLQTIVTPGTHLNNRNEILADLNTQLVYDDELQLQLAAGYRDTARSVRGDVCPLLNPYCNTQLVGYSLGGAVAAILAAYMTHDGYALDRVVTFGQPRVTDKSGAQLLAQLPLTRYKAARDVVPDLPSTAYRHFGSEIILLDGPYYVHLTMGYPDYDYTPGVITELSVTGASVIDHFTYTTRTQSKLDAPSTQLAFCDRTQYIELLVPIDFGAPPP